MAACGVPWTGASSQMHPHVWAAISLGGIISAPRGDVFFHKADFLGKFWDLQVGERVTFELLDDSISGPRAQKVRVAGARKR